MALSTRADIEAFLKFRRIAIAGVSRQKPSYSRIVFDAFANRDYEVIPVHPEAADFEGTPAFKSVAAIAPPPEGVLVLAPPSQYEAIARDAAGLPLWFRFKAPASSKPLVQDECPLMWLDNTEWFHGVHKSLRSLVGILPR